MKFYFEFCYSPGLLAQWVRVLSRYAKVVGSVPGQGNSHSLAGPLGAGRGRETGGAAGDLQPEGPWLAAGRTHPSIRPSIQLMNPTHMYLWCQAGFYLPGHRTKSHMEPMGRDFQSTRKQQGNVLLDSDKSSEDPKNRVK